MESITTVDRQRFWVWTPAWECAPPYPRRKCALDGTQAGKPPGETGPDKGRGKGPGKGSDGKAMERVYWAGPINSAGADESEGHMETNCRPGHTQSKGMPLGARKEVVRPAQGPW